MTIFRSRSALSAAALMAAAVAVLPLSATQAQDMGGMKMAAPPAAQPPASPRDSLSTTIGGSTITVNYGRPSKRGRVLFNGLGDMKWGMVWRTGANEATAFTTTKPLMFGSTLVPAGKYTLFTRLVEDGKWELVVNKQTGQWGTAYDAAQDLARIPMTVTSTNPVVEKMSITVTPAGNGGALTVAWDTYKAAATFTVK